MDGFFIFLLGASMLCTLGAVMVGIVSFAINGDFYKRNSNKLMRLRVLFQGLALVFFATLLFVVTGK